MKKTATKKLNLKKGTLYCLHYGQSPARIALFLSDNIILFHGKRMYISDDSLLDSPLTLWERNRYYYRMSLPNSTFKTTQGHEVSIVSEGKIMLSSGGKPFAEIYRKQMTVPDTSLLQYLIKSKAKKRLFKLLWIDGVEGSVGEFATLAEIGFATAYRHLHEMLQYQLVVQRREKGRIMFCANQSHPYVKLMKNLSKSANG